MLVFSHMKDNLVKEKVCCFLQFCQRKNFILWGEKILYCWQFCWINYSVEKKHLLLSILCKEKLFWGKILFSRIRNSFFFLNRTLSTGVRRVPNSTKVPKEEFKLPFSYLLCVNQRGFLISSSLVKYYIFYDFRQSLCRFN